VIVQSLLADEGNTLLIEQPELHLHPRLQAELADVFIDAVCRGDDRPVGLILETHSEHLLLRLMRRIRETSRGTLPEEIPPLRPEDVSIIYVQPTENGSVPLVMDLDEDGELLTAWPNGFFEEGFRERFA
jgi:predicted ATPase